MSFVEKDRKMQTKFKMVILFIVVLFAVGCAIRRKVSPIPAIDDNISDIKKVCKR